MQEFIVWYKNKDTNEVFSREFNLNQLIMQNHLDEICDSPGCVEYEILSILPSIGKKDIEGNKIYANSSIFEFTMRTCSRQAGALPKTKTVQGYFVYDDLALCYMIKSFKGDYFPYCRWSSEIKNIKIIDTIQENKLGLIK